MESNEDTSHLNSFISSVQVIGSPVESSWGLWRLSNHFWHLGVIVALEGVGVWYHLELSNDKGLAQTYYYSINSHSKLSKLLDNSTFISPTMSVTGGITLKEFVSRLSEKWIEGTSYHLLTQNCQNFVDDALLILRGRKFYSRDFKNSFYEDGYILISRFLLAMTPFLIVERSSHAFFPFHYMALATFICDAVTASTSQSVGYLIGYCDFNTAKETWFRLVSSGFLNTSIGSIVYYLYFHTRYYDVLDKNSVFSCRVTSSVLINLCRNYFGIDKFTCLARFVSETGLSMLNVWEANMLVGNLFGNGRIYWGQSLDGPYSPYEAFIQAGTVTFGLTVVFSLYNVFKDTYDFLLGDMELQQLGFNFLKGLSIGVVSGFSSGIAAGAMNQVAAYYGWNSSGSHFNDKKSPMDLFAALGAAFGSLVSVLIPSRLREYGNVPDSDNNPLHANSTILREKHY